MGGKEIRLSQDFLGEMALARPASPRGEGFLLLTDDFPLG
jgi:hypothetical protein